MQRMTTSVGGETGSRVAPVQKGDEGEGKGQSADVDGQQGEKERRRGQGLGERLKRRGGSPNSSNA